jgi:hypothetical protein
LRRVASADLGVPPVISDPAAPLAAGGRAPARGLLEEAASAPSEAAPRRERGGALLRVVCGT